MTNEENVASSWCVMKNKSGCFLLVLGILFGLIGLWTSLFLAPWAFVGAPPPDYAAAALCYSPLVVAVILIVLGLRQPKPAMHMDSIPTPQGAEQLLQFFQKMNHDYPGEPWHQGTELCQRWVLLQSKGATQAEIDECLAVLEAGMNRYGSRWLDLNYQFREWARSQGHRA